MLDKRVPKLSDNFKVFQLAEHGYRSHIARPDFGLTLAQVMDDAYWGNVASKLRVGDYIRVQPEGMTYHAELLVVDAGPVHAKVKLLGFHDLVNESAKPEQAAITAAVDLGKYKAERNGGWFRVVRHGDNEVMKGGFRTLKAAQDWALDNLQVELA
jgi:hypothetical protein